jgi:hypothetical protein
MIGRQWLKLALGSTLLVTGAVLSSGCAQDADQPARESISAPRSGGGAGKVTDEKVKGGPAAKPAPAAKPDATAKPDAEK